MIDFLRSWVNGIAVAAVITAIITTAAPEGAPKKAVKFACGLFCIIIVLAPLRGISVDSIKKLLARYDKEVGEIKEQIIEENIEKSKSIVEDGTRDYIEQCAAGLGISCEAEAEAAYGEDGVLYPYRVTLTVYGSPGEDKLAKLAAKIESDCGIPKKRQNVKTGGAKN